MKIATTIMNTSPMLKAAFKKSSLIKILMSGYLFLFIFTPLVILPFNVIHLLSILSLSILLTKYRKRFFKILKSPELFVFIALTLCVAIYSFFLNPLSAENYAVTYYYASTLLELIPCAIFISLVLLEQKLNLNDCYDIILLIGMMQVASVILTMLVPELREQIILSSGDEGLQDTVQSYQWARIYGLARSYTFAMPLFQGLCVIIAFILGAYKSAKYYLLIPFFIFSIAVNARTALLCMLIVPCVVFFFRFKKQPLKQIVSISLIFLLFFMTARMIQSMAESSSMYDTWFWLNKGIEEVLDFKEGEATGNLASLTDKMWFMPTEIDELIFGTGESVFGRSTTSSDIGYVVNLYYGGLIFSIMLYLSYLILFLKYYGNNIIEKNISVSIIFYLFIANLKGNVFRPNEIISGVLLLIVFSITFRKFYQTKCPDIYHAYT